MCISSIFSLQLFFDFLTVDQEFGKICQINNDLSLYSDFPLYFIIQIKEGNLNYLFLFQILFEIQMKPL